MLFHVKGCSGFPFFQDRVAPRRDFFNVMVHVLDEEDVIIERFFIFWISCAGTRTLILSLRPAACRAFLGDEFQALEHGLVDLLVGVIDHGPNGRVREVSQRGKHVFNSQGEIRECFDERDNAFALFDLDLRVFDSTDLFFYKAAKQGSYAVVDLAHDLDEEFLIRIFELRKLGLERKKHTNTLSTES